MEISLNSVLLWFAVIALTLFSVFSVSLSSENGSRVFVVDTEGIISEKQDDWMRGGISRERVRLMSVNYIKDLRSVLEDLEIGANDVVIEGRVLGGNPGNDLTVEIMAVADDRYKERRDD